VIFPIFPTLERVLTVQILKLRVSYNYNIYNYISVQDKVLYVAASSLPYQTSGYTNRTHAVIRAFGSAGLDVHVLTRPGYPWDRKDRQQDAICDETVVDDVTYQHSKTPANNRPVLQYVFQAAQVVAEVSATKRVAVIVAASNHVNALPALLAAKKLGIPFIYEMRGLWELSRVSRYPEFMNSQRFKMGLALEGLVARHASHVFVISEQLRRYVHEHFDVPEYRIGLLPNCVDPHRFEVPLLDAVEPLTIAYAGSLIEYEGLDTLLQAVAVLGAHGIRCQLNIAGDGEARPALNAMVVQLGIEGHVRFFGKLNPDAARQVIARAALVCIPRKPYEVCKIVPPIKLVEALAMAKPVIVPDLPVFRDELGTESAALFFRSGDVQDLARVLKEALYKPLEMRALGLRARAYVEQHRTWTPYVHSVLDAIDHLVNKKQGNFKC
jgi:glycosyltransferase involved in cell wall biosynthesis